MNPVPTELKLVSPSRLQIHWNDGHVRTYSVRELREACPCATCRERRRQAEENSGQLPVVRPEETKPLRIQAMQPVGSYAYSIHFSDGHNTGIYPLELLRNLGH